MTYLHKLAKRLSLAPAAAVVLASCTQGTTHDYLGPDPNKPKPSSPFIGLSITPHDPQVIQGDSVRLQAQGWLPNGLSSTAQVTWSGAPITPDGWFRSVSLGTFKVKAVATSNTALSDSVTITVIPPGGIARLDVTPSTALLAAGTQQQFTAVAMMGNGSLMYPTVQWTATGGSITSTGLFTAAHASGDYVVTALIGDGAVQGRAQGSVTPAVLTSLDLDHRSMILESGGEHQFVPSARWSNGSTEVPAVSWSATGGTVSASGVYTAGSAPGAFRVIVQSAQHGKADTANVTILPRVVSLRLLPLTALLAPEATQVVTALALRSDGTEAPIGVQWSAQGGAISLSGTYTAGGTPGLYPVTGTLQTLSGGSFSATVNFQVGTADEAAGAAIFVAPDTTLYTGATARFRLTSASGPVPAVNWTATGGSIDASGLYVAGAVPGNYRVIATRKNGSRADTAQVTVIPVPPVQVQSFTVSPSSDILGAGQTRQFSATLSWSDGQAHPANITWVSSGGTITQNGFYTAGTVAGTYLVIAMCGCGAADTAAVTIPHQSAGPAVLTQLLLSPSNLTMDPGEARVFSVTGVWSDGATSPPPVSYSASGGSITASGIYIAGPTPGTYEVIATQAGGGKADTSVVTIRSTTATLTQLVLNPSAVTVPSSGTQAFVVSALWSDGSTTVPPLTWSATGGTVSNDGVYTAGTTGGTFRVIVSHTGGTKADTSVITVPSAVTLNQLVLNPGTVSLAVGGTQQFAVTGSWSDGSSTAPSVTWTVSGGSMTQGGLYTAGTVDGTYNVIARHTGGTKADTTVVTITGAAPPPPLPPSGPVPTIMAELPRAYVNVAYQAPSGQKITLPAGTGLQAAINNAQCGDEILLAPGAIYYGAYYLPAKSCASNPVHIRTAGTLPPDGVRVTPATASGFAKIVSNNGDAPFRAANGARGYRLIALELYGTAPEYIGTIYIGGDGRDPYVGLTGLPGYIVLDRLYVHGLAHQKSRRCVALNGIHLAVVNSYLSKCQSPDTDAQAIWGSYGPGPYHIENNYLEGTGENVMFGGSDSPSADMLPQDITIRRNHFNKPDEWRTNGEWLVKNLFELKVGKRLLIEGNVFEGSWSAGHSGFAIGWASMNQSQTAPWSQVADVTFRKNIVRHSGAGINLAGTGTTNATVAERFTLIDNVFEDIGRLDLRSDGRMVQIINGVKDVYVGHNTFIHTPGGAANSAIYYANGATPRNTVVDNVFTAGQYGIIGDAIGQGTTALAYYAPQGLFVGNVFAGSVSWSRPANNFWVSSLSALGLDSQLRLGAVSGLKGRATDGKDPGADIDAVIAITSGVVP